MTQANIQKEITEDYFKLRNIYQVQHGKPKPDERYVICADINDIYSGLGCLIKVLAPCWKYALETGRTLIIDWRGNPYTRDTPEKNLFSLLFEQPNPSEIGVNCIADDTVNTLFLPQPILGPAESIKQESGEIHDFLGVKMNWKDMAKIVANAIDLNFPTILPSLRTNYLLANNYGPNGTNSVFTHTEAQRLYKSLKLKPQWATMVSDFYDAHMSTQPVIGVHVRHGNGEGSYRDHFKSREISGKNEFIKLLANKIHSLATKRFKQGYTVFLCTDSDDVIELMQPLLPSLVTRRIWRPPSGHGVDFDHAYKHSSGGLMSAINALVDMQLLAKCDAVLMTRWTSFASHVPYIMEKPDAVFLNHKKTAQL